MTAFVDESASRFGRRRVARECPPHSMRPPGAARGATMSAMASTDRAAASAVTAPSPGALVRRVREAVGIEREALARRAGVEVELLVRAEAGEQPLDDELLDTLLLVLGHARSTSRIGLAASRRDAAVPVPEPVVATTSAPTRGQLVAAVRAQLGIDRAALALRAGLTTTSVGAIEEGRQELSDDALETLLLVLGHQPAPASAGEPGAAPRLVGPYDAGHLAEELAAPIGERLERAMGWNRFAAQLAGAALEPTNA